MSVTLFKPAGLTVFPPHADPEGDCVLGRLLADDPARAELAWPTGFEGGIAHRLDRSTSGALVVLFVVGPSHVKGLYINSERDAANA